MANGDNNPQEYQDANLTNATWQHSVSIAFRHDLVEKMVTSLYPNGNPDMPDEKMASLMVLAQMVEEDAYETANTRSEYYHRLAEQIFKVQKDLEMKKQQQIADQESIYNN